MKKGFANIIAACALVFAMAACGQRGGTTDGGAGDTVQPLAAPFGAADTLWGEDSLWCDIQRPFVENGRQVLYRHITFYDGDTQVMDYVYIPKGDTSHARRSVQFSRTMSSFSRPDMEEVLSEYDFPEPYTHVDLGYMPRDWYRVVYYKGAPVLTVDYHYSVHLTDSTLVTMGMEPWVEQLRGVEPLPDGGYVLSLVRWDFETSGYVAYRDTISPLDSQHISKFRHSHYTTHEHLKNFVIIDVDNWTELVDPLYPDYEY